LIFDRIIVLIVQLTTYRRRKYNIKSQIMTLIIKEYENLIYETIEIYQH